MIALSDIKRAVPSSTGDKQAGTSSAESVRHPVQSSAKDNTGEPDTSPKKSVPSSAESSTKSVLSSDESSVPTDVKRRRLLTKQPIEDGDLHLSEAPQK